MPAASTWPETIAWSVAAISSKNTMLGPAARSAEPRLLERRPGEADLLAGHVGGVLDAGLLRRRRSRSTARRAAARTSRPSPDRKSSKATRSRRRHDPASSAGMRCGPVTCTSSSSTPRSFASWRAVAISEPSGWLLLSRMPNGGDVTSAVMRIFLSLMIRSSVLPVGGGDSVSCASTCVDCVTAAIVAIPAAPVTAAPIKFLCVSSWFLLVVSYPSRLVALSISRPGIQVAAGPPFRASANSCVSAFLKTATS